MSEGFKKALAELDRVTVNSELRPTWELTIRCMDDAMSRIPGGGALKDIDIENFVSWVDRNGKVYAIAPDPIDGHPTLTIRTPISKGLGSWITTTAILLGTDESTVKNSITVSTVIHTGAWAGMNATVKAIARNGNPMDGIEKACEIMDRDFGVNQAIASALRKADEPKDPEGMN